MSIADGCETGSSGTGGGGVGLCHGLACTSLQPLKAETAQSHV